jgi:hypothetical protein
MAVLFGQMPLDTQYYWVWMFDCTIVCDRCVSITCLSFSADTTFLCSSSNTETVHVFKLEGAKEK